MALSAPARYEQLSNTKNIVAKKASFFVELFYSREVDGQHIWVDAFAI
jgi:hypothetical protein